MNWHQSWRQKRLEGKHDDLMVKVDHRAEYLAEQERVFERQQKLLKDARELEERIGRMQQEAEAIYQAMPECGTITDCPKCIVGEPEREWAREPLALDFWLHYTFRGVSGKSKRYEFLRVSCAGCGFFLGREKTADVDELTQEEHA